MQTTVQEMTLFHQAPLREIPGLFALFKEEVERFLAELPLEEA
jgi:hypothetical protein